MYICIQQWMDSSMGHPMDPRAVGMLLCKYSGAEWSLCVHFTYGRQKIPVPPYFLCHTRVVPDVCVSTSFVRGKLPMRLSVHDHVVCEADDAHVYQCTCMCSPTLLLPSWFTHPLVTGSMTSLVPNHVCVVQLGTSSVLHVSNSSCMVHTYVSPCGNIIHQFAY